jgi:hypothetical protein
MVLSRTAVQLGVETIQKKRNEFQHHNFGNPSTRRMTVGVPRQLSKLVAFKRDFHLLSFPNQSSLLQELVSVPSLAWKSPFAVISSISIFLSSGAIHSVLVSAGFPA